MIFYHRGTDNTEVKPTDSQARPSNAPQMEGRACESAYKQNLCALCASVVNLNNPRNHSVSLESLIESENGLFFWHERFSTDDGFVRGSGQHLGRAGGV